MNKASILAAARTGAALLLIGLIGLTSACGYKTSSSSFISNGTGTTVAPTVTSISVEPFNAAVPRGLTKQFTATALYSNGTKADVTGTVTWSSSTTTTATINATGLLTALNLGSTTVTATLGAVSGSTPLTVTAATLVSIDVMPASPSVASGGQLQLLATGIYTDFSTQNLTTTVTWASSNPLVATISSAAPTQGVATGVTSGTATITATLGAVSGSTVLTVTGATLMSITVTPANTSVPIGLTQQFVATGTYSNGTQQNLTMFVTWASSTPAATISNVAGTQGLASTAAVGPTVISATLNGTVGSTNFTVAAATLVSITVTPATTSIAAGTTFQYLATGTYNNGNMADVTNMVNWNTSAPAIATIGNTAATDGRAQANTLGTTGTTAITATSGAITSNTAILTVTAPTLVSIAVTPVNPTIVNGATLQFVATGTYTAGPTQVITDDVTWSSGTRTVASISNLTGPPSTQGLATALSPGQTLITATFPGAAPVTSPPQTLTVKSAYAYATNTAAPAVPGTISQYSINAFDGQLTALNPVTVAAGINAFSIAINPAGTYAYVANYNKGNNPQDSSISQYSISPVDGTLTLIGTTETESNPNSVTVDPQGNYVYVSDTNENNVSEFVINQMNGTLAIPPGVVGIGGALFSTDPPAGDGPSSIAITPADTFAYVANYNGGTVSQFAIGAGGALAPIAGEPATVPAQAGSSYVIVDPKGRFVYVTNQGAGTISEYSIGADGGLTNIGTTPVVATGTGPSFIAIDATGTYAYVADSDSNDVSFYHINPASGALTLVATYPTGPNSAPYGVTIDATGRFLYVAERITFGVIAQFAISPIDGTLMPLAPATAPAGAAPTSIATTP